MPDAICAAHPMFGFDGLIRAASLLTYGRPEAADAVAEVRRLLQ